MEILSTERTREKKNYSWLEKLKDQKTLSLIVSVVVISVVGFLLGRVCFLDLMFPCGVAVSTVLIHKNSMNLYMVLPVIAGMLTTFAKSYAAFGEILAVLLTVMVLILMRNYHMNLMEKAIIAVSITAICSVATHFVGKTMYRFDIMNILMEVVIMFALIYMFGKAYDLFKNERARRISSEGAVASIAVTVTLAFVGTGIWSWTGGGFSLPMIGALLLTLMVGFYFGIGEGVLAGTASTMVMVLTIGQMPAIIVIFACAGMTAGFFKGMNRITAGCCFAATCVAFGMVGSMPELYIPVYEPILAGAIFMAIPDKWAKKLLFNAFGLRKNNTYGEFSEKNKMTQVLENYLKTYKELAVIYDGQKNERNVAAYQFRALAESIENLIEESNEAGRSANIREDLKAKSQIEIKTGEASYPKEGIVSGDSYTFKELTGNKFALVLSDGMGKGEAAGAESNLAVNTLANLMAAGIDTPLALKTLNTILLMKSESEIFSTMDIGIIDRNTSKLKLFKTGAAATFIKRGDKVAAVKLSGLPLGIVDGLYIDYVNVRLRKGDQIIMISDGVIDADRGEETMNGQPLSWIVQAIQGIRTKDPQTMADLIINKAVNKYGLRERDDLTVLTAVVA